MNNREHVEDGASRALLPKTAPATDADSASALSLYRGMQLVRGVELAIESMHKLGSMSGSFHSSLGQEACAVGVCSALRETDIVTSTHRGHGHAVAKGVPIGGIFAELLGRATGVSGGRGGSMHLHHRPSGFYGETAIVAGGVAWAAGAAWARRRNGSDDIAVAFIGDGAFAQGVTHETLLLARHWGSPCLIVCENNALAHSMSSEDLFGSFGAIAEQVAATGVKARYIEGHDVLAIANGVQELVDEVRRTRQPAFLECGLYRVRPHSVSDADYRYRAKDAGTSWLAANDPVAHLRRSLEPDHGAALDAIDMEVDDEIALALQVAEEAEATPASVARANLYATPALERGV